MATRKDRTAPAATDTAVMDTAPVVDTAPTEQATGEQPAPAAPAEGEVTLEQAKAEASAATAPAAKKSTTAKVTPLVAGVLYTVTGKGLTMAATHKTARQRPDPAKAGTGKDWYDVAVSRATRRSHVMQMLAALCYGPEWRVEASRTATQPFDVTDAKKAASVDLQPGSENVHTLLGLCHACGYLAAVPKAAPADAGEQPAAPEQAPADTGEQPAAA